MEYVDWGLIYFSTIKVVEYLHENKEVKHESLVSWEYSIFLEGTLIHWALGWSKVGKTWTNGTFAGCRVFCAPIFSYDVIDVVYILGYK